VDALPRRSLESTTLGTVAPVLALVSEETTLPSLERALAQATPRPCAVLVDGPAPLEWLDAIRATGAEVWHVLRRLPDDTLLKWLLAHKAQVRVMVALVPGTPTMPDLLDLLDTLKAQDVRVQVSIDPLLAGVTDTRAALGDLLASVASRGLRQVSMGYLALDARAEAWVHRTQGEEAPAILAQYRDGPRDHIPGHGPVRLLPRARRQRGYAGLLTLAAEHGLTVCISPLANPDFDRPRDTAPTTPNLPRLADIYLAAGRPRTAALL
jgi:hypothetical protein